MQKLKAFLLSLSLVVLASPAHAVLDTINLNEGVTPTDMANSLLSGASGITINSVTYTGDNQASGTFTDDTNAIGFTSGIVLTSGNTHNVEPPNDASGAGTSNTGGSSALLSGLIGGATTNDAAILTIVFTPTGSQIQFSYVFGSEEYNEFVNSSFNDVFGFFVNGTNQALLPGTNTPVAINNVNCGTTGVDLSGPNCNLFINNPTGTQLDGITQVLTLVANVTPGVENTLVLGIADTSDSILDSAVFIAGGSLQVCGGPGQPPCGGGTTPSVPEPTSLLLFTVGLVGLAARKFRR